MLARRWVHLIISILAVGGLTACVFPLAVPLDHTSEMGQLQIDINYTGMWYRDTFNYAREAPNIRHFVLVMPVAEAEQLEHPGWVFGGMDVQAEGFTLRADRQEYAWALDYLYEAPQGYFFGEFAPGTYWVAVAFVAAPLTAEEAGAGSDAILWPGITGGGASTDFETVVIDAGETVELTIQLTDNNGWACPWLYVDNGVTFERRTEILRNVRDAAQTETTALGPVTATDGWVTIRIAEEKDEVTVIDALYLLVDGVPVRAAGTAASEVAAVDGDMLVLRQGESAEFRFAVPPSFTGDDVALVVTGYYVPGGK